MKEIVEQVLGYLPKYIPEFLRVLSSPKTAILERNKGRPDDLREGLIFYGISFFLIFPLQRALIPNQQEIWTHIAQSLALAIFIGSVAAALTRLAWRIVGANAPLDRFLVVYCYFSGVTLVVFMFPALIALGALKTFYPESYKPLTSVMFSTDKSPFDLGAAQEIQRLQGYWVYNIVYSVLGCFSIAWYVIAWGAYRQLTGLTRLRSAVAFILTGIFLLPVAAAGYFIQRLFM
jgi:hypothetical protein